MINKQFKFEGKILNSEMLKNLKPKFWFFKVQYDLKGQDQAHQVSNSSEIFMQSIDLQGSVMFRPMTCQTKWFFRLLVFRNNARCFRIFFLGILLDLNSTNIVNHETKLKCFT